MFVSLSTVMQTLRVFAKVFADSQLPWCPYQELLHEKIYLQTFTGHLPVHRLARICVKGPATVKLDLGTYANSEYPDQPAHSRGLIRIFTVRLHKIWILLKIKD